MKKLTMLFTSFLLIASMFAQIGLRPAEAGAITKINPKQTMYVITDGANFRTGPSLRYGIRQVLKKNSAVVVYEKTTTDNVVWYHGTYNGIYGWISSKTVSTKKLASAPTTKPAVLLNVPLIAQMPELPRGCEVTSLAMFLQYKGVKVDKMTLAKNIQKVPFEKNGLRGHPDDGFVGSMYTRTQPGFGVYHGPVFNLTKKYLPSAVDMTGQSFDSVIKKLNEGKPVWVITNMTYTPLSSGYYETWKTRKGYIKITRKEHSVVITGYDSNYIYFNDPWDKVKNRKAPRTNFIKAWEQMGKQAISY